MENIVSARRLRKSMLKNNKSIYNGIGDIGISEYEIKRRVRQHEKEEKLNDEYYDEKESKTFLKYKVKLMVQIIVAINIVFISLILKLTFEEKILDNKYAKVIITEYNKDYTKEGVLEKLEEYAKKGYKVGKYIIPEKIANYTSSKYVEKVKPYLVNFDLKEEVLSVFNNTINSNIENNNINTENTMNNNEQTKETGMGGGEPIEEANIVEGKLEEAVSAISMMDSDVEQVLSKKIDIKQPTNGTVTSRYGVRNQIFDNVNPYHTGIDIANKLNTEIHSATEGTVKSTESMNKYYGNNIEIEKDGVIFKYAHLNKINVKVGDKVKQGDLIGLMGSTGMSTGSHLHFEIKINNRTIDPEKIINF